MKHDKGEALKMRRAVFHLLEKLHAESNEDGGIHWAECDALVEAMGWESWDAWRAWEYQRVEAEP